MTTYSEADYLQISGLQHFLFCRRQWALIHIENLWAENQRTTEGALLHERAHSEGLTEKRGNTLITRGVKVFSPGLGVSGACDVLEFHADGAGVPLRGWEGLWLPYPVEYKRGEPKEHNADAAQLCLQAMCLEEMLCCCIAEGALFYGETRRRQRVEFSDELRCEVKAALSEMRAMYARGYTPRVKPTKACSACSLKEQCLPALGRGLSVRDYIAKSMEV